MGLNVFVQYRTFSECGKGIAHIQKRERQITNQNAAADEALLQLLALEQCHCNRDCPKASYCNQQIGKAFHGSAFRQIQKQGDPAEE